VLRIRKSKPDDSGLCLIIAGGGTGGHLFPGIAIARELEGRFEGIRILFVVGHKRMEKEILSGYGFPVSSIQAEGLKGRGWKKGLAGVTRLPKALFQSIAIIRESSPALVLGVGGYSSGPMCLAAKLMGIPTAIHEQNSFPGLTNRLLSGFVDRVLISFEESRGHLRGDKIILTGNPVRQELFSTHGVRSGKREGFTLLVGGGSPGARAINEAFAEALELLKAGGRVPEVIHQTGEMDYHRTVEDYRSRGLDGELVPFIKDMAGAYHRAEMVIGRAGASTLSELAALAKPSILIPYPHAANRHQEANARSLVQVGGAVMILQEDMSGEGLAQVITRYMDDRSSLHEMGERARSVGRLDAAKTIVDQLVEISAGSFNRGDWS
jgi:UDP-N-acetylglucosamine--N-acetylmuramyl-(pentapeptide) pyrophosphoryl-undecaprenol N-acetylglucosamine transferase